MFLALPLLLLAHPFLPPDPPLLVRRKDFDCLVRNIDTLPKKATRVTVTLKGCPPLNFSQSFYPEIPPPRAATEPAETLWLNRTRIDCIRAHRRNIGVIARPSGKDHYLIDYRGCRRPSR